MIIKLNFLQICKYNSYISVLKELVNSQDIQGYKHFSCPHLLLILFFFSWLYYILLKLYETRKRQSCLIQIKNNQVLCNILILIAFHYTSVLKMLGMFWLLPRNTIPNYSWWCHFFCLSLFSEPIECWIQAVGYRVLDIISQWKGSFLIKLDPSNQKNRCSFSDTHKFLFC